MAAGCFFYMGQSPTLLQMIRILTNTIMYTRNESEKSEMSRKNISILTYGISILTYGISI